MAVSITQILHVELDLLFGASGAMTTREVDPAREDEIEMIFRDLAALRSSVGDAVRRYTTELSQDELIELQSRLHTALDDAFSVKIKKLFERRALAMVEQAERDPVTTLPNRAAFNRKLGDEMARARRYRRDLSLVLFDVDGFKLVNDQFGHTAGDRVLAQVGRVMKSSLRQSDAVFRYGGDEFAAICPETPGEAMANLLRRLESNLRAWRSEACWPERLNVSWGTASFPADAAEESELIEIADQRLYARKRSRHRGFAAMR